MHRLLKSILRPLWNFFGVLFTGGKYGAAMPTEHSHDYGKFQEQKRKDLREFGGHPCKICGTRIPGNRLYCGACYHKYVKK